jgi:acyl dehydratase
VSGLYYEDLVVGSVHHHSVRRTVTETDNVWFSLITLNTQPLHLDEEFSKGTIFGGRIVNSLFTLALITGMSVTDLTLGTTLGNLGFNEISFPNPVRHGDTLRSETHVVEKRLSQSRKDAGIVTFRHLGYNQRDEVVCSGLRVALMLLRPSDETA